jgi:uncharacterized OsmC-like protein
LSWSAYGRRESSLSAILQALAVHRCSKGEWVLGNGAPQFRAILQYEHGQSVLEMDNPSFMGGGGTLPGPMHYCFSGLAACYASTFAIVAAELGLELRQLRVRVEADVNFLRTFGLADAPTMEEVRVQLLIDSPASDEQLQHAEELAPPSAALWCTP